MRAAALALTIAFVGSCGASIETIRQKNLQATLTVVNSLRDGFVVWDDGNQTRIVDDAKTFEDGKAALVEYRTKRELVVLSFEAVYKALAVAALDLSLANVIVAYNGMKDVIGAVEQLTDKAVTAKNVPEKLEK